MFATAMRSMPKLKNSKLSSPQASIFLLAEIRRRRLSGRLLAWDADAARRDPNHREFIVRLVEKASKVFVGRRECDCIVHRSAMNWSCLLSLFVAAGLLGSTVPSCSQGAHQRGFVQPSVDDRLSCSDDGSATAPSGSPQLPDLLRWYKKISPCQVAGVNYAVGYGSASLKDPINCACLPRGTTIDSTHHFIRVTNTPNVTLSGFDFSLHGGYLVYCDDSPNLTIENSNFAMGANGASGVAAYAGCTNIRITNNVFDGVGSSAPCGSWSVIMTMASGITLRYNWIKNFSQHVLEANGGGGVEYKYNLIEEGGWCPGAHLNYSQLQGSYPSPQIAFNTFVQHVQAAGGEGIQMGMRGSYPSARIAFNTSGQHVRTASDDIKMGTINKITNARVEYNTMISMPTGQRKALSYMIACHQDTGLSNTGFVARNNYLDTRGAYGAFYPQQCAAASYTRNWNMVTGLALPELP